MPEQITRTADDDDVFEAIARGRWAMLEEALDDVRANHAARIEEEILEAIPEVCAFVKNELDEVAARREKTQATYRRRAARFEAWATEAGWKFPFPASVVCLYFIQRTNAGAPISEIHSDRVAIAACHEERGAAAPCRRDPLVRAVVKFLSESGTPPDDGQPVTEQQHKAA
jgi:hypothetical protein